MARLPILFRRGYFESINRNLNPKVYRPLEWNVVDTELGPMAEPRQFSFFVDGKIVQLDALDMAYDRETEFDSSGFYNTMGTYGPQRMIDFDY